ncbi:MAG: MMPL family transporter, partial [Spirochaetales bacterium]|nr:MMPL family transporter [Spirochaetales bacterium]
MKYLYRYPILNVVIILGITLFLLLQIPQLQMDNDTLNFIPEDDPALIAIEKLEEQYGSYLIMDLVIINPYGSLLDSRGLEIIDDITEVLDKLEGLEEVQSLTNTDFINSVDGTLRGSPISEGTDGRFLTGEEIRQRLNSWDMYDLVLLSDDEHSTQIGITLEADMEVEAREKIYNEVKTIASEMIPSSYTFYLAGLPATTIQISHNIKKDLVLLIPFVVILVLIILYLSFRRPGGVVLPILNVTISTIWTLGMMAFTNTPMTILSSIIPVLMIAVGSAYGIHLISHYYDELDRAKPGNRENHRETVWHTVKIAGTPIVMAGLTTMAGFGSLAVSSVLPMKSFGIFTTFGVASALLVAMILIPSLLLLNPGKPKQNKTSENQDHLLLGILTNITINRKILLSVLSIILIAGSIYFLPRVVVDNDIVAYFKETTEVRRSENFIRENFAGTNSFDMVISGKEKGALNNPEILLFMDNFKIWILENYSEVGKIISYSDFIKRINQVLNEDTPGKVYLEGSSIDTVWEENNEETFWGNSFPVDNFSSDSGSFFESEQEEVFPETINPQQSSVITNNSDLMENLWTAYLNNPDNFIEALAELTNYKGMDYYEIPENPEKYNLKSTQDLSNLI